MLGPLTVLFAVSAAVSAPAAAVADGETTVRMRLVLEISDLTPRS